MRNRAFVFLVLTLVSAPLLAQDPEVPADPKGESKSKPDANEPSYHPLVRDAVAAYPSFMRVDDAGRFAPERCFAPPPIPVRISDADKDSPHGKKIYSVYAQDAKAYGFKPTPKDWKPISLPDELAKRLGEVEQILVKQAWKAEVMTEKPTPPLRPGKANWGKSGLYPIEKDGKWWRGDEFDGLFLMIKPKKTELATDAGWIYATVAPDLKTITGAGLMQSCMECHKTQPSRIFGLPPTPETERGR
jgi:hypothetical protein